MLGEPFSALVSIQQSSSGAATGTARLDVNVVGNFYLFPFPNNQTGSGATYSGNTDFRNYNPNFSSGSWPDFTFSYFNGSPSSDVLTAQFNIAGINTADDNGPLSLTLLPTSASVSVVSPVPLPPTLPLFASGLLALGLLAFWRRRPRRLADAIGPTSPLAVIDLIGAV
jgi:MYXO-CTERM domain-containing protein